MIGTANDCEAIAVALLAGVGDPDREWWYFNPTPAIPNGRGRIVPGAGVGHLRVPVTPAENALVPAGVALIDAGESGPLRRRTCSV